MVDISTLWVGTFVLNKKKELEKVITIKFNYSLDRRTVEIGYRGDINGRSSTEFEHAPVTVPFLSALGWTTKIVEHKKIIYAYPSADQLMDGDDPESLELMFLLENDAVSGYYKGNIVYDNGDDFLEVIHLNNLEHLFYQIFAQRMRTNIDPLDMAWPVSTYAPVYLKNSEDTGDGIVVSNS